MPYEEASQVTGEEFDKLQLVCFTFVFKAVANE